MENEKEFALKEDIFSEGWGILPNKIARDKEISAFAKVLYVEISSLCASKGYCWANNRYFADLFGKTQTTISTSISQLEKYLTIKDGASGDRKIYIPLKKFKSTFKKIERTPLKKFKGNLKENLKDNNINNNTKNNINNKLEINSLLKKFEQIDLKNKNYYNNTTQRKACEFLLKEYGEEKVVKVINFYLKAKQIQENGSVEQKQEFKYLPSISSPWDLQEKWSKFADFVKRMKQEKDNLSTKVIF
jgi:hypothetical protein